MTKDDSPPLTRDIAPFGVRMPADLKARVHAAAEANGRSMNSEIVATLEEKYPAPEITNQERLRAANHLIAQMREIMGAFSSAKTPEDRQKLYKQFAELKQQFDVVIPPDPPKINYLNALGGGKQIP